MMLRIIALLLAFTGVGSLPPLVHAETTASEGRAAAVLGSEETASRHLTRADLEAWLDGFVPYALAQGDIAGALVLVVKDGQVLLKKGYGYANVEHAVPMDPESTVFPVASVGKTLTWTAVMQLVEQGLLELDRDINDYLDFRIPDAYDSAITMRHLMTHTAGFEERIKQYRRNGPQPLGSYLREVPVPARIDPPGEVQAYSNYGTVLAGYIVERVSDQPFEDYVAHHILAPLGMVRSSFRSPVPEALQTDLARSYSRRSAGAPYPLEMRPELTADPAGSLVTTVPDMARFMLAHLERRPVADYALLQPDTMRLMQEPAYRPIPGAPGTTLGFFGADYNDSRVIGHTGDDAGSHSDLKLLLDEGVGLFLFVNSSGNGGLIGAAYRLRASLYFQFMDRYFPASPAAPELTLIAAPEHARLMAGEYEMSRRPSGDFLSALYLAARVRVVANEDGTIMTSPLINLETGRPQTWRQTAPSVWSEVGGRGKLNVLIEDGRVVRWLPRDLSTFELRPVPALRSATWNLPLLAATATVLFAVCLQWPIATVIRRRYARHSQLPRGMGGTTGGFAWPPR
ncbi:hypothetical protein CAI21_08840 [Alkalilimnicola ehrlichii]|uniref:Beta-lactamase-related domain-containing protein n=1 Tax=Alkalilimnicola ehrlichii TaxID=351052 RepID=A0A3E0WU58_9GAMM|nr:serine hydrolase domain-containing protein [Alkalilimnicola ehrlichii]RFA29922.1 hypothetical protein CAI21_08840 [Alkalilimnicola ehrlichii]RFA36510.1 hypothetical protein CAL65_11115 [Alkalilimnicola ehrlichii]